MSLGLESRGAGRTRFAPRGEGRRYWRGLVTKYFWYAAGRLDLIEHWNGAVTTDTVDYAYDDVGNRLVMADLSGTTVYNYDALNRMTSVTYPGNATIGYR